MSLLALKLLSVAPVYDEIHQHKRHHRRHSSTSRSRDFMPLPPTMKAAVALGFGEIDQQIVMRSGWPTPSLPKPHSKSKSQYILIKVLACAVAPGDVRVLSGLTDYVQLPPGGYPYVIGSDTAGIVTQVSAGCTKFQPGDYVVTRFALPGPHDGAAEYRLVETILAEHCPPTIPPTLACGLPASAAAAKRMVNELMHEGDRVLVLGGSGGVGSSVLQYCRLKGASLIVTTSTQKELCQKLGAEVVIDYRKEDWWELDDYHKTASGDHRFDIVFDMVGGDNYQKGGKSWRSIKRGGIYASLLPGVESDIAIQSAVDLIKVSFQWMGRDLWTRLNPGAPRWGFPEGLKLEEGDLKSLLEDVVEGRLQPVVDPASPFAFDEEGVRAAMHLQQSKHAHGKVVIQIAEAESSE